MAQQLRFFILHILTSIYASANILLEGASEGKGLGLRFLRHIERNALLLFMIPGDTDDIRHDYEVLLRELETYNPELLDKQRVLAVTKSDLLDEELMQMLSADLPTDLPTLFISAVTGFHITELKDLLWQQLSQDTERHHTALVHRDKDPDLLPEELAEEGEDEDIFFVDENDLEDVEDLEDFEFVEPEDA